MKEKVLVLLGVVVCSLKISAQFGYYCNHKFIELKPCDNALCLVITNSNDTKKLLESRAVETDDNSLYVLKLSNNRYLFNKTDELSKENYTSEMFRSENGTIAFILPRIILSMKEGASIKNVINDYKEVLTITPNQKLRGQTLLSCNLNNARDVLNVVAELEGREEVEWCEPDMLCQWENSNTYFSQQYYLKNTNSGQYDLNVSTVWNLVKGSSDVTVAIIDQGVDSDHEDLSGCVLQGYTVGDDTGYGAPKNANSVDYKGHGVACAGIVAAKDNTIGVKGVAYGVKILPVNIVPNAAQDTIINGYHYIKDTGFSDNSDIAYAIQWASERADILSCSWGMSAENNSISTAINNARNNGRDGKGCIVIASSGNNYPNNVQFPARIDGVIAVGAIDRYGNITSYSQGGTSLNVVAFGGYSDIVTTDRMGALGYNPYGTNSSDLSNTNYTKIFDGTSAACPQVAGVAALMLSIRPDLTETQVRTTLQQTARDLGATGFDTTYGYGLVDAYAAVKAVCPIISGSDMLCTEDVYTFTNIPSNADVALNTSYFSSGFSIQVSSNLSIVSYSSGSLTVQKVADGMGVINVYYKGQLVATKEMWVGAPIINDVYYMGGNIYIETDYEAGADPRFYYVVINGVRYRILGGMGSVPLSNGTYNVEAYVSNQCGESAHYYGQIVVTGSGLYSLGNISSDHLVTIEAVDYSESPQPLKAMTAGHQTTRTTATTVPYTLKNAQTGEVVTRGEMPVEGGVLNLGSVRGGLYVLTLLPVNSESETFKLSLK